MDIQLTEQLHPLKLAPCTTPGTIRIQNLKEVSYHVRGYRLNTIDLDRYDLTIPPNGIADIPVPMADHYELSNLTGEIISTLSKETIFYVNGKSNQHLKQTLEIKEQHLKILRDELHSLPNLKTESAAVDHCITRLANCQYQNERLLTELYWQIIKTTPPLSIRHLKAKPPCWIIESTQVHNTLLPINYLLENLKTIYGPVTSELTSLKTHINSNPAYQAADHPHSKLAKITEVKFAQLVIKILKDIGTVRQRRHLEHYPLEYRPGDI